MDKETEIPGIMESDIPDVVAGARMACGGSGGLAGFIDRIFGFDEPESAEQTREE